MEVLNRILERAKEYELFRGVWVGKNLQQVEVSHLFSVDDTIILCQPNVEMVQNLRAVLQCFQLVLGLNINMEKSDLVCFGREEDANVFADLLGCKAAKEKGSWDPVC